ncbi:TetR/AcrR family transcriptional regulator [cf. Phormidesmis sp. LEGE 11477]|uniref:TetR/AcrR family transcriptional regulator n=1 Tax=cf. Phormidesmis sp. LEGE 11477 TaxID=1828680 RepID=UPI00187E0FC8|nr:TetR/AcrR family transcriptional regulator [cf. Phormidesmis sp. LEGE 11477]MBE9059864.1 TetR/AcrR family transcriptional regulator [cf. Phormidesmis sp. LEGE 11477]
MAEKRLSSRERIVKSALELFAQQGTTATTTKEIAERAGVNEVTLFRQFGSKQGLLLSVLKEAPVLEKMQAALSEVVGANQPLTAYGETILELLTQAPELVRSLIGESGQSPIENRQALGQVLQQANLQAVGYLRSAQVRWPGMSVEAIATLLNTLVIGHIVLAASSGGLWQNQQDFLTMLNELFRQQHLQEESIHGQSEVSSPLTVQPHEAVIDLPAEVVRSLFQTAKKQGPQEYALVYVLFGAGITLEEAAALTSPCVFASKSQHLLTIAGSNASAIQRQVPVNRWIMGNRYGTYLKNPLTQWLKTQSDEQTAVFVLADGKALETEGLLALWDAIAAGTTMSAGSPATPFQARQTWCIELLMKGMSLENLSILSGMSLIELEPYARRAKEKAALEQALAIDQKKT